MTHLVPHGLGMFFLLAHGISQQVANRIWWLIAKLPALLALVILLGMLGVVCACNPLRAAPGAGLVFIAQYWQLAWLSMLPVILLAAPTDRPHVARRR